MIAKISNSLLRSKRVLPREKPIEIRDPKIKGFLLRIQPSGIMSYVIEYGRGKRLTLCRVGEKTPAQARKMAEDVRSKAKLARKTKMSAAQLREELIKELIGIDEITSTDEDTITLESFLDERYGPWIKSNKKYAANGQELKRIKSRFSDLMGKRLDEVHPWLIEKWRLKNKRKPTTINRDIAALKAAFGRATEWGFIDRNPIAKIKPLKVDNSPKPRFLSDTEQQRLLAALDARELRLRALKDKHKPYISAVQYVDFLKPMTLLALHTGMRRGEIFSLTWEDLDLERRILTVGGMSAKSGKTRHIPLNTTCWNVLNQWADQMQPFTKIDYVFPSKTGGKLNNIRKAWKSVMTDARIENFRWHDFETSLCQLCSGQVIPDTLLRVFS